MEVKAMIGSVLVLALMLITTEAMRKDLDPYSESDFHQDKSSPAALQLVWFKQNTTGPIGILTTDAGNPVTFDDATATLHSNPLLNTYMFEQLSHYTRDKIPERVIYPKGAGAFGYFEVLRDITDICKAKLFRKVGKKTPVAVRFSRLAASRGSADTVRDIRGFSVKFYTEDGNLDIPGINTPIFPIKDPVYFAGLSRSRRRNPVTNLHDNNMFWDFMTLRPETLAHSLFYFGDSGIPLNYRHMEGHAVHTYEVENEDGEHYYIYMSFIPNCGVKNMGVDEAEKMAGRAPDLYIRDLYDSIEKKDYPSWNVTVQVLSMEEARKADFDVFDITQYLPIDRYPRRLVGRIVLQRNPSNYHTDVRQIAFNPADVVPGFLGSPDKMYELRRAFYKGAQHYRLGTNYLRIPVNCPVNGDYKVLNYNRNGESVTSNNGGGSPNYYPNSFHGPVPTSDDQRPELLKCHQDGVHNFDQAHVYFRRLKEDEKKRLVENIVTSLKMAVPRIQEKAVELYGKIDKELGERLGAGLTRKRVSSYEYLDRFD